METSTRYVLKYTRGGDSPSGAVRTKRFQLESDVTDYLDKPHIHGVRLTIITTEVRHIEAATPSSDTGEY